MLRNLLLFSWVLAVACPAAARPLRDARSERARTETASSSAAVASAVASSATDAADASAAPSASRELRVLQLNIWHDASAVPGGFEALVDQIIATDAHIVSLCEVSNHDGVTCDRLVEALGCRGQKWYGASGSCSGVQGTDVCVVSRYPIVECRNGLATISGGVDTKVRIDVDGCDVVIYPAHLDYTHYACYLPRGYDGVTWKRLETPVADTEAIVRMNRGSTRDEAIRAFLAEASGEKADLVLLAGDFNEPSHLDWTDATRSLWDHGGCIVPWDCSVLLYGGGFRDAYRAVHPDPVTHPGFTYPSDNAAKEPRDLTWAPEADERDRIDFVYYLAGGAFRPRRAAVVGPRSSIVRCGRAEERSRDKFVEPAGDGTWPTDHKGVLVTFRRVRR